VVGSWPEPLAQAAAGIETEPVRIECAGERAACDEVADRLSDEGADAAIERFRPGGEGPPAYRVLVGPWKRLRGDPAADTLEGGPARSGVFADFVPRSGEWELVALDARGRTAERLAAGAGLVAALREGEDPPAWFVTGADRDGVEHAVELLSTEALRDRYAVASAGDAPIPLPAGGAP
jgi:hypothetical protein